MPAIMNQAGRKFNVDKVDGVSRSDKQGIWPALRPIATRDARISSPPPALTLSTAGHQLHLEDLTGSYPRRRCPVSSISRKIERKTTFFETVGDDVCGVGAYNPM